MRSIRGRDLRGSRPRSDGMKRLVVVAALAVLVAPGAAPASGCRPIDCAPSQVLLSGGNLLATRVAGIGGIVRVIDLRTGRTRAHLPPGMLEGGVLIHRDGKLLTWFDAATGARIGDAVFRQRGAFALVGASQDGRWAVLARTQAKRTTFALVSATSPARVLTLGSNRWEFDALSGGHLFLLQRFRSGYEVRLYDLVGGGLDPRPLKDARESALIGGTPWSRLLSGDGRYLFTLYIDGNGAAMVHELDLRSATARCIDLPGRGDFDKASSYALVADPDGRQLWAVSPGYGKVVAIDVAAASIRLAYGRRFITSGGVPGTTSAAVMSPDGERIAVALAGDVWLVGLAQEKVVRRMRHVTLALGFAPDNRVLWAVGERSRVSALPAT